MDTASELLGNPTSLLLERIAYLLMGIFFVLALYGGVRRGLKDKK
tara:strand:- start:804 stop:938 length:135 start_codon:yes stop_codon:yes gene_type:complete